MKKNKKVIRKQPTDEDIGKIVLAIVIFILIALVLCGCKGEAGDSIQGPKGDQGVSGSTGATGAVGPAGPVGLTGSAGSNGSNGLDGTIITIVQFCSGTPTYPSTFPEVGLCINNQIYAVYSANDGFLTLVLPGAYLSNAIGSSCNFVVLPNCQVTR